MFKKHVSVAQTTLLGSKDVKKLRADLLKKLPSATEAALASVLPAKAAVHQHRLASRAVFWALDDGRPLFFDPTGHGDRLVPTVYALAAAPSLLPALFTYSEVSPKVLGGADLFLQGLSEPPADDWLAGSLRALRVRGNPAPFAVGQMAVSKAEAERDGMKGRGLALLHAYGDLLWALGDKAPPNAGFTKDRIFPLEGGSEDEGAAAQALGGLQIGAAPSSSSGSETGSDDEGADGAGAEAAAAAAAAAAAPPRSMDELLEAAVVGGLHSLRAAEMPIEISDFYKKHMVPLKPDSIAGFDLKASKYKKLSKLLDHFEKAKLITQKQVRKQEHIVAVDREHPLYAAHVGAAPGGGGGGGGGGAKKDAAAPAAPLMDISPAWRAPSSLRPVFGAAAAADKDRLYGAAEVAAALRAYAAGAGLLADGGDAITVDATLKAGLWSKGQGPAEGDPTPAAELEVRLRERMAAFTVLRPAGGGPEVVSRGALRPVAVVAERRHGRPVTLVAHVEGFGLDASDLASALQRRFQASASLSKLPGNAEKGMEILLQGDVAAGVRDMLVGAPYGLPPEYVKVQNKLKK